MHAMQDEIGTPLTPSAQSFTVPAPDQIQGRSRLFGLLVGVGVLTLVLDQASKAGPLALSRPGTTRARGLAPGLNLIRNPAPPSPR